MSNEKPQPPRRPVQTQPKVVLQSASTQEQKFVTKPDKKVRVPEYPIENFSGGEKEV